MQDLYWKKLERCLSGDRLSVYGQDQPGHRLIAARYLWNIALCEALYAPLHLLEVGLRNAVHNAMTAATHSDSWYDQVTLTPWGHEQVGKAKTSIARSRKEILPGRVVAELHFGFWTSMFESHYESPSARFLLAGIRATFPHMPKSLHNRKRIKADLDRIRILRNRVFHHERIIHWKDLPEQHNLLLRFLEWMSGDLREIAAIVDKFDAAYRNGVDPILVQLDSHFRSVNIDGQVG